MSDAELATYKSMIKQLLKCNVHSPPLFDIKDIIGVCGNAMRIMKEQPVFLQLKSPIVICGDIHGQLHDLQRIFRTKGEPPDTPYLFMGDYVDRGDRSVEVSLLLLAMKVCYPYHIFLLRGNHECPDTNDRYGFREECKEYKGPNNTYDDTLWTVFNKVFQWLPLCASVNGKSFCVHGGLSPELKSLDQLDDIDRSTIANIPDKGLVCDLLWSDPDKNEPSWGENERGCSYTFGPQIVEDFCNKHGFDLVCRAHQVMDGGYEFFCKRRLATVFSASNYCGDYGNRGSILCVDPDLKCSLVILLPNDQQEAHALLSPTASTTDSNEADENEELASIFSSPQGGVVSGEIDVERLPSPPPTMRAPSPRPGSANKHVLHEL